jgi:hypothetical protein
MTPIRIECYDDVDYEWRSGRRHATVLLLGCLSGPNTIERACVVSSFPPSVSAGALA